MRTRPSLIITNLMHSIQKYKAANTQTQNYLWLPINLGKLVVREVL